MEFDPGSHSVGLVILTVCFGELLLYLRGGCTWYPVKILWTEELECKKKKKSLMSECRIWYCIWANLSMDWVLRVTFRPLEGLSLKSNWVSESFWIFFYLYSKFFFLFWKKLVPLFITDAWNWSKVGFVMLQIIFHFK